MVHEILLTFRDFCSAGWYQYKQGATEVDRNEDFVQTSHNDTKSWNKKRKQEYPVVVINRPIKQQTTLFFYKFFVYTVSAITYRHILTGLDKNKYLYIHLTYTTV